MPNCPLTLRTVKGSKLTFNELDGNFLSLQNCINIVENNLNNLVNNTLNNRWHVPYGTTVTVNDGFQSFVYGDLYVEGLIELLGDSQLVVLNGDIILSGGTISGTGVSYVINIPEYDSYVTGGTYNNSTQAIDFSGNLGFPSFSVDVSTLSNDITVVSGVYDNTTGTATFTNNTGGTFTVTGFLTGYTNYYTTGATLNGNTIEFNRTDLTNAYSVDLTPVLSAFSTTDYYTTGATLNGNTVEFNRNDTSNAYSVDLTPLKFTGNTISECIPDIYTSNIHSCSPLYINPNDEGDIIFGSTSGVTIDVVNGKTKTTTLQITSGATNGYVLTSDALGNAIWQATSGGVTGFTYSNNELVISQNQGQPNLSVTIDTMTGLTINGELYSNTISACTGVWTSNFYGCSPITVHDSIQSVGSTATGATSLAFGENVITYGNYSQAGGDGSKTGIDTAFLSSINSGVVYLDPFYGDVSGQFTNGNILYIYDEPFDNYYGRTGIEILSATYTTQTEVTINDFFGFSTTAYVGDLGYLTINYNWGGDQTIPGHNSHSEGYFGKTISEYSHAEGIHTTTSGKYSHAEGFRTVSFGESSHAEGFGTQSNGEGSHAEGLGSKSLSNYSHAEGVESIAFGYGSHTEGYQTQTNGAYSHAEGLGTITSGDYQHTQGLWNDYSNTTNGAFILGNGTDDLNRSNLMVAAGNNVDIYGQTLISGKTPSMLTVVGSGTTNPIFKVLGSQGELFSITDNLIGSLFSVNDISGLPILEVFSDNTILMGGYQAPSLNTTIKSTLTAGTNTVYSIPTSAYTGAFVDYTVMGTSGARAGNIMSIWSGTSAQYTESSTNDIGLTTDITFSVSVSGDYAVLSSSAATSGWTLKTIIRSI